MNAFAFEMIETMNQNLLAACHTVNAATTPDARAAAQAKYDRVYAASFALIESLEGEAE